MKTFGWTRPVREVGVIVGSKPSPVRVRTLGVLGGAYGVDKSRRLVLTMAEKDLLVVRPERTGRALSITAQDLYGYLLRCEANRATLEKARERKAKKAQRLADQRQARAERKLDRLIWKGEDR